MKKILFIICLLLLVITSIGGYFAYVDYTTRQKKKEAKRLLYAMQEEISQAAYIPKMQSKAEKAYRLGEKERNNVKCYASKLAIMMFEQVDKGALNKYDQEEMNSYLAKIPEKYEIDKFFHFDKETRKISFYSQKFDDYIDKKMLSEKKRELAALKIEKERNAAESKKEIASLDKIAKIKAMYNKKLKELNIQ